jgi:hypothetical protein
MAQLAHSTYTTSTFTAVRATALGQVISDLGSAGPPGRGLGQGVGLGLPAPCSPGHATAAEEVFGGLPGAGAGALRMSPLCLGGLLRTQARP